MQEGHCARPAPAERSGSSEDATLALSPTDSALCGCRPSMGGARLWWCIAAKGVGFGGLDAPPKKAALPSARLPRPSLPGHICRPRCCSSPAACEDAMLEAASEFMGLALPSGPTASLPICTWDRGISRGPSAGAPSSDPAALPRLSGTAGASLGCQTRLAVPSMCAGMLADGAQVGPILGLVTGESCGRACCMLSVFGASLQQCHIRVHTTSPGCCACGLCLNSATCRLLSVGARRVAVRSHESRENCKM